MRSLSVVVVIALGAVAILAAVVVLAMGRGGELTEARPDYPPLPLPTDRRLVGMDAAMLRLPRGMWGYQVDATDEALRRLAYALAERDTRVTMLEEQVAELQKAAQPEDALPSSWYQPPEKTPWSQPEETPWSQPEETPWSQPEETPWSRPEQTEQAEQTEQPEQPVEVQQADHDEASLQEHDEPSHQETESGR